MAPKYAAIYTSVQVENSPDLEEERFSANGSRDPSPSHSRRNSFKDSSRILKPSFEVKHFRRSNYGGQTNYQPLPGNEVPSRRTWSVAEIFSHSLGDYSTWIYASLRASTAVLQVSLVIYLQIAYLKLPRTDTEQLPRISDVYANYPFMSCVGSLHLTTYRTFTALIVALALTTDSMLFIRNRKASVGYWFRRLNILASLSAYMLALWLSYAASNAATHLHLSIISMHSIAVLVVKTSSLATDHASRSAHPLLRSDDIAITIRRWKEATVWFALPMAILLNMGTYTCRHDSVDDKQTPGTACYRVLAIAAPADWLYALVTVNWSLHMGYEISRDPHISKVVARSRESMLNMGGYQDGGNSRASYKALGPEAGFRSTLWDAEHPDIDLEDVPAALVKEVA